MTMLNIGKGDLPDISKSLHICTMTKENECNSVIMAYIGKLSDNIEKLLNLTPINVSIRPWDK